MKIITLLVAVFAMGYCEAQFTFGIDGLAATQNCVGSNNCNQNKFSRKRRQILEDILSEVEAEESARDVTKREAQRKRFGNGSFGRKKREIAQMIESLTEEVLEAGAEEKTVERQKIESEAEPQIDSFIAAQKCLGSNCNQDNFGRKKREVIAALLEELL